MSLQHRPYNLVAMPARSGGFGRGLPPEKRRPHSSATRRRHHRETDANAWHA